MQTRVVFATSRCTEPQAVDQSPYCRRAAISNAAAPGAYAVVADAAGDGGQCTCAQNAAAPFKAAALVVGHLAINQIEHAGCDVEDAAAIAAGGIMLDLAGRYMQLAGAAVLSSRYFATGAVS